MSAIARITRAGWAGLRPRVLETLRREPALFFPAMALWRWRGRLRTVPMPGPTTDLVVEGFFRSGNTYAVRALEVANGDRLHMAHHSHAAATVKRAAARGVPTIVLIRRPRDAVLSDVLKFRQRTLAESLRAYRCFYEALLPYRGTFVTASFEEITTNLNGVIARVNDRWDARIAPFPDDANARAELAKRMGEPDGGRSPRRADLPLATKERAKARLAGDLHQPRTRALLHRAERTYRRFLAAVPDTSGLRSPFFP